MPRNRLDLAVPTREPFRWWCRQTTSLMTWALIAFERSSLRYGRYESDRAIGRALADHMKSMFGVTVNYDGAAEVIVIETPGGGAEVHFVGHLASVMEDLVGTTGKAPDELVTEGAQLRIELRRLY
jgi:hypothetical protein